MKTREIPRKDWPEFFGEFSRRHEDWLVTVTVIDPIGGAQIEAREMPLAGMVADRRSGSIYVGLGRPVEHVVARPVRVQVEAEENGAERAIEIESRNGSKTIVEFRVSHPIEMVDGIAGQPVAG